MDEGAEIMSGGSSTPAPAPSTTTSIQDIPAWEQGYVTNLLGQAQTEASQPYQQFPGQQVAGFTPDQLQSFSNVENASSQYAPLQAAAANSAVSGANTANNIYGAGAGAINASTMAATPQGIAAYESPFLQSDITGLENTATENWNQNIMPGVNNEFVNAGQSLSGRNAQVLGQAANEEQTNLEGQVAGAEESAYSTAGQQAQNEATNLANAGTSLGNLASTQAGAQNAAAATQGNLASQTAATNLTQNQALQAVGQEQQQQNQTNINTAMTNWQNQVQYPEAQTTFLSNIIHGLPSSTATTTAGQTTPVGVYAPSPLTGIGATGAVAGAAATKRGGLIKKKAKKYAGGGLIDDAESDDAPNPISLAALNAFTTGTTGNMDDSGADPANAGPYSLQNDMPTPDTETAPLAAAAPTARPAAPPPDYSASTSDMQGAKIDGEQSGNPLSGASGASSSQQPFTPISDSDMQKYQLLALARGMLQPTRTGSPWESLGAGIGGAQDIMLQQQKWNKEMLQAQNEANYRNGMLGARQQAVNQQGQAVDIKQQLADERAANGGVPGVREALINRYLAANPGATFNEALSATGASANAAALETRKMQAAHNDVKNGIYPDVATAEKAWGVNQPTSKSGTTAPAATAPKIATQSDIAVTAAKYGKTPDEVKQDLQARGFTIQ
jgi:hypothetical protein